MWDWAFERISRKLAKWNSNLLSLPSRFQVFHKILSSYPIYFSSMWLFNQVQINSIQKIIRNFYWSDGSGVKKIHIVSWDRCTKSRAWGGLGLKDLKFQGVALVVKLIAKARDGEDP